MSLNIHSHTHIQDVAAATWTISHGLKCYPNVSVKVMYNGVMTAIIPKNVSYPDVNTVQVDFSSARSGEARLA